MVKFAPLSDLSSFLDDSPHFNFFSNNFVGGIGYVIIFPSYGMVNSKSDITRVSFSQICMGRRNKWRWHFKGSKLIQYKGKRDR